MGGRMDIKVYAINLDRSRERWDSITRQAGELDLDVIRVPGIDGSLVQADSRIDCDDPAFRRNNGRTMLPGEYGCYRSHLQALQTFISSGEPIGIIVEDDVELTRDMPARVAAAFEAVSAADVIKLFNHRVVGFRLFGMSSLGDEVGRATHGPMGSAACYAVSRSGAIKLLDGLACMEYPWDVALERGWATGAAICTVRTNMIVAGRQETTIASRSVYKTTKFPWWKRSRTYLHRVLETVRRVQYARGR
jgi:glycosyl transferase, family 25